MIWAEAKITSRRMNMRMGLVEGLRNYEPGYTPRDSR